MEPQAEASASSEASAAVKTFRMLLPIGAFDVLGPSAAELSEAFEAHALQADASVHAQWERQLKAEVSDLRVHRPDWLLGLFEVSRGSEKEPAGSKWAAFIRGPDNTVHGGSVHMLTLTVAESWPDARKIDVCFATKLEHYLINRAQLTGEVV
eukprot:SAG31_NODE_21904_length_538_cov_0.822323_1_plen_152_part_10